MKIILLAFSFIFFSFWDFSAYACSPVDKNYLRQRRIYIYNKGKDIPTNGRIWIRYFGDTLSSWKDKLVDLKVLDEDKNPIPVSMDYHKSTLNQDFGYHLVEIYPNSFYKPNRRFTLFSKISKDYGFLDKDSIISNEYVKILEFTTGAFADTDPPVIQSGPKYILSYPDVCENDRHCCGIRNLRQKSFSTPKAVDNETRLSMFYVYRSGPGLSKPVYFHTEPVSIIVSETCLLVRAYYSLFAMKHDIHKPTTSYLIRAVDFAGNLSEPIEWHLPYECDVNKRHNPRQNVENSMEPIEFGEGIAENVFSDAGHITDVFEKVRESRASTIADMSEGERISFETGRKLERRGCFGCNGLNKGTSYFTLLFVLLIFLRKGKPYEVGRGRNEP